MRISTKYGFTFLCTPKCASTSIEKALTPYSQLMTKGDPQLKHTNYKQYNEFIKPFLSNSKKEIEVVCLMREPISWLHSWYRFQSREALKSPDHKLHHKYSGNMTFEEWINDYLSDKPSNNPIKHSQHTYFIDKNGKVGVDKIFKYENMVEIKEYFELKVGEKIEFPRLNISPIIEYRLTSEVKHCLKDFLKVDYEIYNTL